MNNSPFNQFVQNSNQTRRNRMKGYYYERQKQYEQQNQQGLKTKEVNPQCSKGHPPVTMVLGKYKGISYYRCPKCNRTKIPGLRF